MTFFLCTRSSYFGFPSFLVLVCLIFLSSPICSSHRAMGKQFQASFWAALKKNKQKKHSSKEGHEGVMKSQFYRRRNRGSARPGGLPKGCTAVQWHSWGSSSFKSRICTLSSHDKLFFRSQFCCRKENLFLGGKWAANLKNILEMPYKKKK